MQTTSVSSNQQNITITGLDNNADNFELQASGSTYVYMIGTATNATSVELGSDTTLVQVINQSGTASGFVTLVKMSA